MMGALCTIGSVLWTMGDFFRITHRVELWLLGSMTFDLFLISCNAPGHRVNNDAAIMKQVNTYGCLILHLIR